MRRDVHESVLLGSQCFLGVSRRDGEAHIQSFPGWLTIPCRRDLDAGRRWHLFFAWVLMINGLVYFIVGLATGHLRRLLPTRAELRARHLLRTTWNHLRLRFPHGDQALEYNILQKLRRSMPAAAAPAAL